MSPKPGQERLVKVATAANEAIARMLSELLAEQDIHCVIKAAGVGPGIFSPSTLPHYLYVLATDASRAKEVVTFYLDSDASIGLAKEKDSDRDNTGPGSLQ